MRRDFDSEFKQTIVELHQSGQSATQLAQDYGIDASTVRKWRRISEGRAPATKSQGAKTLTAEEAEILRLRQQIAEVTMERDILKKAIRIFSKSDKESMHS